jgi:hypothetical protein
MINDRQQPGRQVGTKKMVRKLGEQWKLISRNNVEINDK